MIFLSRSATMRLFTRFYRYILLLSFFGCDYSLVNHLSDKRVLAIGFLVEEKPVASDEEFDDEYLPACCRNDRTHKHPV